MAQQTIVVKPQLAGVVTNEAFQMSQRGTAFDSFNFWSIDNKTGRLVPGTRPKFSQLSSPTGIVTMLQGVNGKSALGPFNSFAAGIDGDLYFWNGSGFTAATGAQADEIDTDRYVSAAPFVNQLVITKEGAKPIIFDYPTGVATTVVETAGTAPSDARIVVPWQGTVWLTARDADPHVLYAPRVGVLTDWDYSVDPEDQFGAFFTDTETEGKLSGPVNALMPQTSDTMIVSTFEGLLAMRGHPRQGGVIETIAPGRYVLGQGAWCRIPGDVLLFLTPLGIMTLDPSPNAVPAPLSKQKMPEELIGLTYNYDDPTVTMVYDNRWNQVHLFNRGTFEQGWTFDLGTGSWHRIDSQSYPFCVTGFAAFDSEQSSGTLFGRYDGIHYMDKFATDEEISAGFTLNPIKISESTMSKGLVDRIRVIFGRNSPSSDLNGSLRMACGIDAQDAISKALAANFDFEVDLQVLKRNNGIAYPKISGHAVVYSLTHANGDVSIEEIHMDVSTAGYNRGMRAEQFAADGEETNFTENLSVLDVTAWTGYQQVTPLVAPATALADYTHFLDLSLMDATWWSTVQQDGRDIRVSNGSNVEVPADLIYFNYATSAGLLAFKLSQSTTPLPVRVWVGNPNVVPYDPTATNGQYNTYDDNWRSFFPDGGLNDRTQYNNDLALTAGSTTQVTGPIGGPATDLNGSATYADANFIAANSLGANTNWTMALAAKRDSGAASSPSAIMTLYDAGGLSGFLSVDYDVGAASAFAVRARTSENGGSDVTATSSEGGNITTWSHLAGTWTGAASRIAYRGGVGSADTTSVTNPTLVSFNMPVFDFFDGGVALVQIHDTNRPAAWLAYQAAMLSQVTFWSLAAFTQVNSPFVPSFSEVACPSGVIVPVETGTWSGYAAATPDTPSASILNSLHLIDLSALPANWWSAVASDGHDIRATDANNVFLPLDLIDFDSAADTGFAVVRQNQYDEGASQIRLWVGNATAITVSPCALYGQYGVYDADTYAFWPGGSGTDRTQWLNNTATMTPDTTGPFTAVEGTTYNGSQSALASAEFPSTVPITMIAAAKIASGTLFEDATLVSLTGENSDAAAILKTKASANPARLIMRKPTGGEITAGNTALVTPGNWWLQSGVASGSTQRRVLVNGSGTPESTIEGATVAGLTRATIGGQTLPDDTAFNQFTGSLSLVSIHGVIRTDAWIAYQNAMLNQTTFWNTWAWTASSSSLPQP